MLALAFALVWIPASKSNEILGRDGEPIVCPGGETLKTDLDSPIEGPSQANAREAERNLPDDKTLAFNEYTGEFEVVDSATASSRAWTGTRTRASPSRVARRGDQLPAESVETEKCP